MASLFEPGFGGTAQQWGPNWGLFRPYHLACVEVPMSIARAVVQERPTGDLRGGMVASVIDGYPQREVAEAAYRFQREVDDRERRIVGVNAYVDAREVTTVPVLSVPAGSLENHMARLERTRRERDAGEVEAALRGLRETATRPGSSDSNLMPHFIRCAAAYATLGEQCNVLRGVFGEYREPAGV